MFAFLKTCTNTEAGKRRQNCWPVHITMRHQYIWMKETMNEKSIRGRLHVCWYVCCCNSVFVCSWVRVVIVSNATSWKGGSNKKLVDGVAFKQACSCILPSPFSSWTVLPLDRVRKEGSTALSHCLLSSWCASILSNPISDVCYGFPDLLESANHSPSLYYSSSLSQSFFIPFTPLRCKKKLPWWIGCVHRLFLLFKLRIFLVCSRPMFQITPFPFVAGWGYYDIQIKIVRKRNRSRVYPAGVFCIFSSG